MWNQYLIPNELSEALELLVHYSDRARVIAGGTDLVLDFSSGKYPSVDTLVDISSIRDLKDISVENGEIHIGSAVTLSEILHSNLLKTHARVLVNAVQQIAGPQVRNIATIGGNVVNASPAADAVPALLVLDASVTTASSNGAQRQIPLDKFLLGNRKVDLNVIEIVSGFQFPIPDEAAYHYFRKVQPRRSMAIAMLNLAIVLQMENERITNIRIAMGAVAPTAVRLRTVENDLRNMTIDKAADIGLYAGVKRDIMPISDFRASNMYRLSVAQNLLREVIVEMLGTPDWNSKGVI